MSAAPSPRPRVLVSRCLGFDACRYDGTRLSDPYLHALGAHVDFETVCPEVAIGLGVPRDTIRVVRRAGRDHLLQPATGRDLTETMRRFAERYVQEHAPPDGVVLKSRSPSCAIRDTKIHAAHEPGLVLSRAAGLFGRALLYAWPELPIVDEVHLASAATREAFYASVLGRAAARS